VLSSNLNRGISAVLNSIFVGSSVHQAKSWDYTPIRPGLQ
jgi:hypothetical protein